MSEALNRQAGFYLLLTLHTTLLPMTPFNPWLANLRTGLLLTSLLLLLFALLVTPAHASEIRGRVVAVADGDTVTVLDEQRVQHRVRLQGIDAPEARQAFGQRSRQYLASMIHNQEVLVRVDKIDRFGRAVGVIYRDGEDVNLRMVQAGLAWHYKQYQREQTPEQRRAYAAAEDTARRDRVGLWSEPNPMAPWDFRRAQRQ